ncbi:MAG: NIPSNAP family protein [Alphaproteobacteria bacterium]|nr:NIPSNAP family protein [Alphaproteobacteria bacterium]
MIVDHRTYTFYPSKMNAWIENYERFGLPVQKRHLGQLVGFFVTDIGPLNQVVFMWAYADIGDREQRRSAMEADPDWAAFLAKSRETGSLKAQENKILKPTSFSPLR